MSEILGKFTYKNGALEEKPERIQKFPGQSIYAFIKVAGGIPVFLKEHLDRLYRSLALAGREPVPEREKLEEDIQMVLEGNHIAEGNLQMVYVPLEGAFDLHMYVTPLLAIERHVREDGASMATHRVDRENPNIKTVSQSYKNLLKEKEFEGMFELLLVDAEGLIREGSRSNVFFVLDEKMVTPPAKDVLPGITRMKVMDVCREEGIQVEEGYISTQDLEKVCAVMITGTSVGILGAKDVDGKPFDAHHPFIRTVRQGYERKMEEDRQAYIQRRGESK